MIRWLVAIATIVAVYFVGGWLLANPGEVQINWFGYDVTVHIAVVAGALALLMLVVSIISILLWRVITWPQRRRARKRYRTFRRGLEQLTRGVAALAMGNESAAEEALKKAIAALPGEPLPQLLNAQLLQRQGNHADAQLQFRALMSHSATAELATRRIIEQHVSHGEWNEAIRLAEDARKATPRDRWLALILIDLYAREEKTTDMLALTEGWQWQSPLTKEERNRYAALAYYIGAKDETNPHIKEKDLRHAVGYAPEFLPATVDYAYLLLTEEAPRRARKWLLSSWKSKPSTLLITPILAALKEGSPRMQERLLKPFLRGKLQVEHHLLAARHALDMAEPAQARKALDAALQLEESKEAMTLMAELERKLRNDEAANGWLARAVSAPQGQSWICQSCGASHAEWHSHCMGCQSFDTLRFEKPEARITSVETPGAKLGPALFSE